MTSSSGQMAVCMYLWLFCGHLYEFIFPPLLGLRNIKVILQKVHSNNKCLNLELMIFVLWPFVIYSIYSIFGEVLTASNQRLLLALLSKIIPGTYGMPWIKLGPGMCKANAVSIANSITLVPNRLLL